MSLDTQPGDVDQIKAVIAADTQCYMTRDRVGWGQCFVQDARFQSVMECGGLIVSRSFEAFREVVFDTMDEDPGGSAGQHHHTDYRIDISGDMAWARFDQVVTNPSDAVDPPRLSYNIRVLSREPDGWRIVFHGVWAERSRDTGDPTVEIDANGRVLWISPAAQARLPTFPGLTISQGTLRATRPDWDRDLRATIARGTPYMSVVPYRRITGLAGTPLTYPVILGDSEDGQRLICWVRIEDFRMYVSFGAEERLARCLASARAIFSLSETQSRLLALIADGLDLSQAATHLGTSPSTTRTHLNRIFDKVGVRSQTALLRVVLGSG